MASFQTPKDVRFGVVTCKVLKANLIRVANIEALTDFGTINFLSPIVIVGGLILDNLTVTGNTILGDAALDTLIVNATSTFNSPVTFNGSTATFINNVTIGNAPIDVFTVNAGSTFNASATFNGNVTLGNAAADSLTINSTTTFAAPVTFTDAATVTMNSDAVTIGNAVTDVLTVASAASFTNAANRTSFTAGTTTPATAGHIYTGAITAIGAWPGPVATGDTRVGRVTFTSVPDTGAGLTTAVATFTNALVTGAGTVLQIGIEQQTTTNLDGCYNLKAAISAAGTVSVNFNNGGGATTGAAAGNSITLTYTIFN